VGRLRRPSLAAWLVNQLALREPNAVEELLGAGSRLREVEDAMLGGKSDPAELRSAAADERDAIGRLVEAARDIAKGEDRDVKPPTFDRVTETLQAASVDPGLAERVRAGRLDKEARAATIGVSDRAPARARGAKAADPAANARAQRDRVRAELETARRDLERAEARRARAQDEVDKQTERLKQARTELADAKREAKRLATAIRRAEARLEKRR